MNVTLILDVCNVRVIQPWEAGAGSFQRYRPEIDSNHRGERF